MQLTHLVMFKFWSGASASAIVVPDVPGIEYKADSPRLHWKDTATQRMHWQADAPRMHWQDKEEHVG